MNFTHALACGSAVSLLVLGSSVTATSPLSKEGAAEEKKLAQNCLFVENKTPKCFDTEAQLKLEVARLEPTRRRAYLYIYLYEHVNFNRYKRGWVKVITVTKDTTQSRWPCNLEGNLPGKYNDEVSSLKVAGCRLTLYEHDKNDPKYPGRFRTFASDRLSLGTYNDKASYWRLRPL